MSEPKTNVDLAPAEHFEDFELYYLGDSFQGLPLTSIDRSEDFGRTDWTFIYGSCTPKDGGEPSCAPPLEIQNWSVCVRFLARYPGHPPPTQTVQGASAAYIPTAGGVDAYTGRTTVVVFNLEPAPGTQEVSPGTIKVLPKRQFDVPPNAREAIEHLRPVGAGTVPSRLPGPDHGALEGRLPCQRVHSG